MANWNDSPADKRGEFTTYAERIELLKKLTKCANSLHKHTQRGYTVNASRSLELIDRYNDLRAKAIDLGVWEDWCNASDRHADVTHTGYDYFA
jgi:hypothetical protein